MSRSSIVMWAREFNAPSKRASLPTGAIWGTSQTNVKGYWKLRVGDYRVVFRIVKNEVWIFGIMHRGMFTRELKNASLLNKQSKKESSNVT